MSWGLFLLAQTTLFMEVSAQTAVAVSDVQGFKDAVDALSANSGGTTITLAPGLYDFSDTYHRINCDVSGVAGSPITIRAAALGTVTLRWKHETNYVEGFVVTGSYWKFENLILEGACLDHSRCEHAFHVVGNAEFFYLKTCILRDFNAMIKVNINNGGFPDDGLIEGCEFYDTQYRMTSNPVTPINIDGGRRWRVVNNFIHDHAKNDGGYGISYAAFMKSNGRDGVFERNLVHCTRNVPLTSGYRLGLSFGGGGTSPDSVCEDATCSPEHQGGIMRNNMVIGCNDVGIYINECASCQFYHNTLYDTTGIDCRFAASSCDVQNNLVAGGAIRTRDGATLTNSAKNSLISTANAQDWFTDPANLDFSLASAGSVPTDLMSSSSWQGSNLFPEVSLDLCLNPRPSSGVVTAGSLEYAVPDFVQCDTSNIRDENQLGQSPSPSASPQSRPGSTASVFVEPGESGTRGHFSNGTGHLSVLLLCLFSLCQLLE